MVIIVVIIDDDDVAIFVVLVVVDRPKPRIDPRGFAFKTLRNVLRNLQANASFRRVYVSVLLKNGRKQPGNSFGGALVLTGLDLRPMAYVENLLKMHDIPVIISNVSTFDTMDSIRR